MLVNVESRSETSIVVGICSENNDTVYNKFYRYKSGEIEKGTGHQASELLAYVDDVLHTVLVEQGVEIFNISIDPTFVPTTVDYIVPTQ